MTVSLPLRLALTLALALPSALVGAAAPPGSVAAGIHHYSGLCEASAAVALDDKHFAVADDESNDLRIYRVGTRLPVRPPVPLADFLKTTVKGEAKASDLEAAARVGDTVYWLSSHSLTSAGKSRDWRRRLFATQIDTRTPPPQLKPIGKPYAGLLDALLAAPALKSLGLAEAAKLPPEAAGGLNIEGLAAAADGGLLIGFRNPLVAGKALLIPLQNPAELVNARAAPRFAAPITLDLGGRGIRSIERTRSGYLIVAGPTGNAGSFALFKWSGVAADAPVVTRITLPAHFGPEALIVLPGSDQALLLSDDGARCDKSSMRFQALSLPLP